MRRPPIGFLLRIALSLLVVSGAMVEESHAVTGDIRKDPAAVVEAYLSLDMKGARLEAASWEALKPYIDWKEEQGWEHAVVIESYEVVEDTATWEVLGQMEVIIPVRFQVLGVMYWETAAFVPEAKTEEFRIRVKVVEGRWRIIEPRLAPHIGRKRLINFVRRAILQEPDANRQVKLAGLRDILRKAETKKEP
ncbi:MAG: hypothetical protein EPO64_02470 [Nitrospirae bacterium]|nr:MAG: hypothetical protein EPO64_02470 [Nitrospirota bacterium]